MTKCEEEGEMDNVVHFETPIPGMGAFARVADTEGKVIGLFQSQM